MPIDTTYVYQYRKGGWLTSEGGVICKVPLTPGEALSSDLMSMIEKTRCTTFISYIVGIKLNDPKTHKYELEKITSKELFEK